MLSKGDKLRKNEDLEKRLSILWKIKEEVWKLILLGKGYFNVHMQSGGGTKSYIYVYI